MSDADLHPLEALLSSLTDDDHRRHEPPADLWDAIEAAVTVQPVPLHTPRRRWAPVLAVAAAVVALAGLAGVLTGVLGGDDGADELASVDLDPFATGYEGDARLLETDDGRVLDLRLGELPPAEGYYEVWLIKDLTTGEMQSLGPIDESGRVAIPDGLDVDAYSVVDISVEPFDGIPTHSGQSVLRGQLS